MTEGQQAMTVQEYNRGDIILREGDPSDFAYMILSGEVEVFTEYGDESVVLGVMKTGEFLGEMGIVDGQPRSASARAKNHVSLKIYGKQDFFLLISQDSSSAYQLISRLCEQLRTITRKYAEASAALRVDDSIENEAPFSVRADLLPNSEPETEPAHDYRILLLPSSSRLTPVMPAEGIEIFKLPFSIGRSLNWNEPSPTMIMDLIIPDKRPFRLSREHFALYQDQEGFGILDLGSTLGTQINGVFLGRHFGRDFEYLKPGENRVVAGGLDSPFVFKVLVEPE